MGGIQVGVENNFKYDLVDKKNLNVGFFANFKIGASYSPSSCS